MPEEGRPDDDRGARTRIRYREYTGRIRPGNRYQHPLGDRDRAKESPEAEAQSTPKEDGPGRRKHALGDLGRAKETPEEEPQPTQEEGGSDRVQGGEDQKAKERGRPRAEIGA